MGGVLAAAATVFLHFHFVRVLNFVFLSQIVLRFTHRADESVKLTGAFLCHSESCYAG